MLLLTVAGIVADSETGAPVPYAQVDLRDERGRHGALATAVTNGAGEFALSVASAADGEGKRPPFDPNERLIVEARMPGGRRAAAASEPLDLFALATLPALTLEIPPKALGRRRLRPELDLLNEALEKRDRIEVGETLMVAARGLRADQVYDALITLDGDELFSDRLVTMRDGVIRPTALWPQVGLNDPRGDEPLDLDGALRRWKGKEVRVELRGPKRERVEAQIAIAERIRRPLVAAADADGQVRNALDWGDSELYVVGRNITAGDSIRVYVVPRQHGWALGDAVVPVTLVSGRAATTDVQDRQRGRFHIRLAGARELAPGAYDLIVRPLRYGYEDDEELVLRPSDIVVNRLTTGFVVRKDFMATKTVRGGCVNYLQIAGRSVAGAPYFQYADVFQVGEPVYAALDPAALNPNHTGKMVALYLVPHKTAAQWSADTSLNHLAALGGNPAVQKFLTQPGCINFNKRLLWPSASAGDYDVVAEFGNSSGNAATFAHDDSFDTPLDIIDGYFVPGFRVVPDPTTDTSFAIAGQFQYDSSTEGSVTVAGDFGSSWTVPLNAVVYFPADTAGASSPAQVSSGQANYPLVVIVHGNATPTTSYLGYAYLLEHLAKNGFIAASIHLQPGEYATDRAEVLFAHLALLKAKFGAKVANNIGLMGHSRGGEAVTVAARLNNQQGLGHNINAVIALAPTDWIVHESYGPPWAVPYLVIYGAMDGDVAGIPETGFALFDRASGADKSMVFAYGAIHDRFNTVWGDGDLYFGQIGPGDLPKIATAAAHEKLAKGYMTAFFRMHLRSEASWAGIFSGEWIPAQVAAADPNLKLYVQYVDTGKSVVDDFEGPHTPTSWETSSLGDVVADDGTLPVDPVEDELATIDAHSPHDTAGLLLRWDGVADHLRFAVPTAQKNVTGFSAISFRVTQKVNSAANPVGPQDFRVVLADKSGKSRAIKVGKFAEIPEPQKRDYDYFTKSAMRSIRIPLHVFTIDVLGTQRVNLKNIDSVSFEFDDVATGEVEIDSVEFTT